MGDTRGYQLSGTVELEPPVADAVEVLLTLSPLQYSELGQDLADLRVQLGLPPGTSNTQVILEAVRRQAHAG